jgi:hypothetical protein
MSDRRDYYFKQPVTEAELDTGFDLLEQADRAIVGDLGLYGIMQNVDATEKAGTPDLSVDVSGPGVAYDQVGQRLAFSGSSQNVDVSVDEGAASTAVVTPGNEKWLSIFLAFDRELLNPRTDGTGATVFFERNESFEFNVVQGTEAAVGLAVRPSLRGDEVLVADVLLDFGMTQVFNADVDKTRTELLVRTTGGAAIAERDLLTAFDLLDVAKGDLGRNNVWTGTNEFDAGVTFDSTVEVNAVMTVAAAGSIQAEGTTEYDYKIARSRVVYVNILDAFPFDLGVPSATPPSLAWVLQKLSTGNKYVWEAHSSVRFMLFPIRQGHVPSGGTITDVEAWVTPGLAVRGGGNEMKMNVWSAPLNSTFGGGTNPVSVQQAAIVDDDAGGGQILKASTSTAPVWANLVVDHTAREYWVEFISGNPSVTVQPDKVIAIRISFNDPGPRNS